MRRLHALDDDALATLTGVVGVLGDAPLCVVIGAADALPWIDGVRYLGRDDAAAALLLPTTHAPDVAPALLARAVQARVGARVTGPIGVLVDDDGAIAALVPLGGARRGSIARGWRRGSTGGRRRERGAVADRAVGGLAGATCRAGRRAGAVAGAAVAGDRPARGSHADGRGEPDGVAGLSRRGDYQRLLLSEWALADAHPEEFLRRAAGGEHVFLACAPPSAGAPTHARAVLGRAGAAGRAAAGPPRRAAGAGAARGPGGHRAAAGACSSVPGDGAIDDVGPDALGRLLAARTATTATAADVDAWCAAEPAGPDDDLWLVGGPALSAHAARVGAGAIIVQEVVDPVVRARDVELRRATARRVRLDLPAADVCARLLRDPRARAAEARVAPAGAPAVRALWFLPGDRKLVIDRGGRLDVWPVPGSPRAPAGNPRTIEVPEDEALIALGTRRRAPIRVTRRLDEGDDGALLLRDPGVSRHPVRITVPGGVGRRARRRIGLCFQLATQAGRRLVVETSGRLLLVDLAQLPGATAVDARVDGDPFDAAAADAEVIAAVATSDGVLFAQRRGGDRVQIQRVNGGGVTRVATVPRDAGALDAGGAAGADPTVRFGFQTQARGWGPVAVQLTPRRWSVASSDGLVAIETDAPVHGAAVVGGEARLLIEDDDGRRCALLGVRETRPLPRAGGALVAVACGGAAAAGGVGDRGG